MAEFKVGGKVICIKTKVVTSTLGNTWTYTKNSIYIVNELITCACGMVHMCLGDVKSSSAVHCTECGKCATFFFTSKVFTGTGCFLPLDDFKEVTFEKIKNEVPVSAQ